MRCCSASCRSTISQFLVYQSASKKPHTKTSLSPIKCAENFQHNIFTSVGVCCLGNSKEHAHLLLCRVLGSGNKSPTYGNLVFKQRQPNFQFLLVAIQAGFDAASLPISWYTALSPQIVKKTIHSKTSNSLPSR
jgi:hypothetical protein